jgi:hypothetical protein
MIVIPRNFVSCTGSSDSALAESPNSINDPTGIAAPTSGGLRYDNTYSDIFCGYAVASETHSPSHRSTAGIDGNSALPTT